MINGHLLNDRYQLKERIGGGGMANVYLATDQILKRDVAIKVLRMEYVNDEEFIARFDREAQAATSLSHPNIVNIYDVGEEDHILYMVMEYVDGMTLKEYIQQNGPLPVEEAIPIMKQITSAITHAHENNIVHRDIKPQNILMDTYGNVKVTDFGIAVASSATALTETNSILGSVHYLSPEQARGGKATKKSDIYSLGIVFYELLTGELPFSGQTPVSIALKHLQADPPSVRHFDEKIPQSVENIVLRAMTKDPFHRYQTVSEMESSLNQALKPEHLNEEKYVPPVEEGEETKAIPIIRDDAFEDSDAHMIHDENTKKMPVPKKEKKRKKKWLIIIVTLFVLLASSIAAMFIVPYLAKPKDVKVPDVVGMEYNDAVDQLAEHHLKAEQELIYSDDVEEGFVVKTDPRANRTVKEESTVNVYVSQGKEKITFDNYVGSDFEQVERLLEEEGFEDIIAYEKHSDQPEGEIITQIQPNADTEVVPSDTKVIFEISAGPEKVSLNNLVGMTEDEVKQYLEDNGLVINQTKKNSDQPKGEVIQQSPKANTLLEKGSTVDVTISLGPKEKPPASQTVSFTVPYRPEQTADENEEPVEQTVKIYIEDTDHKISEVYKEDKITKDTSYKITLTVPPDSQGEYKVVRDDELLINKTVSYEEGE